jgi:hypothetical protein
MTSTRHPRCHLCAQLTNTRPAQRTNTRPAPRLRRRIWHGVRRLTCSLGAWLLRRRSAPRRRRCRGHPREAACAPHRRRRRPSLVGVRCGGGALAHPRAAAAAAAQLLRWRSAARIGARLLHPGLTIDPTAPTGDQLVRRPPPRQPCAAVSGLSVLCCAVLCLVALPRPSCNAMRTVCTVHSMHSATQRCALWCSTRPAGSHSEREREREREREGW